MPIVVANSVLEELAALKAQTLKAMLQNGARRWESDPWEIGGLSVQVRIAFRPGRGGQPVPYTNYYVSGRRKGYNALIWTFKRMEIL